ncbi:MAG: hypothetical protein LUH15_09235 [Tannerellaceae bacterium]|nr:hypothetical protein [Tannerellaceae bacterium]
MEFSKSQKKIARELINKGLHKECALFLEDMEKFINHPDIKNTDSHESYLKLYKKVVTFDKHVARRYDAVTGSRYFITLLGLFYDKVLDKEDLALFNEEVQNRLLDSLKHLKE